MERTERNITVVVIDDDRHVREFLRLTLDAHGDTVHTATNGQEGLRLLQRIPRPAGILLDVGMPVMDGIQFLEARAAYPELADIPVIICTADSAGIPEPIRRTYPVLHKPFKLAALRACMDETFDSYAAL